MAVGLHSARVCSECGKRNRYKYGECPDCGVRKPAQQFYIKVKV